MKTLKITTNKNLIASTLIAIIILLSGCQKNNLLSPDVSSNSAAIERSTSTAQNETGTYRKSADLMAGQHLFKVGIVELVDKNNGMVEVRYAVNSPWKLHSIKLYVGDLALIPMNANGQSMPEFFPYKQLLPVGGSSNAIVYIQKSTIPKSGIVSANAKVFNGENFSLPENAWANGLRVSPNDPAMYYNYNISFVFPAIPIPVRHD